MGRVMNREDLGLNPGEEVVLIVAAAAAAVIGWNQREAVGAWLLEHALRYELVTAHAALPVPGLGGAGLDGARLAIALGSLLAAGSLTWRLRRHRGGHAPKVPAPERA